MREIVIEDTAGRVGFIGEQLGQASGENERKDRWTEMNLYRKEDGSYVLQTVGRSAVYHRTDNRCGRGSVRQGVTTRVTDLPQAIEPCTRCEPPEPEDLDDSTMVNFESPRFKVQVFPTIEDLMTKLRYPNGVPTPGGYSPTMSRVASDLVADAASRDPSIADTRRAVRYI